jgi:thiamine-monophosphate kinase
MRNPAPSGGKQWRGRLSDFAAMSGVPQFALVTLIASPETSIRWITKLYRGLAKAAEAFNVAIVGGETSRIDGPLSISVSMTGEVEAERWASRSGGRRMTSSS